MSDETNSKTYNNKRTMIYDAVHCRQILLGGGGVFCGVGSGQTRSLQSIGQNYLILSNKYCWRSSERPGGWMMEGRFDTVGFQFLSFKRLTSLSGLVKESFTVAIPGLTEENVK